MKDVFVIDDDRDFRSLVLRALGDHYRCTEAQDGEDALVQLMSGYVPDLIVLDVNMPVLNGAVFLEYLRGRCIPIVVFTDFPSLDRFGWIVAEPKSADFGPLVETIGKYLGE